MIVAAADDDREQREFQQSAKKTDERKRAHSLHELATGARNHGERGSGVNPRLRKTMPKSGASYVILGLNGVAS